MTKIGIMMGDDIGYEVVPECVKVMRAAAPKTIQSPPSLTTEQKNYF